MSKETKRNYDSAKQDHKIALQFACHNLENPSMRDTAIREYIQSTKDYHKARVEHYDAEINKVEKAVFWTIVGWFAFVAVVIIASIFGNKE